MSTDVLNASIVLNARRRLWSSSLVKEGKEEEEHHVISFNVVIVIGHQNGLAW